MFRKRIFFAALFSALALAAPARADPVVTTAVAIYNWAVAAVSAIGFSAAQAAWIVNTVGTALISQGVGSLVGGRGSQRQQDIIRELQIPNGLPSYRFVYGEGRAPGTPAPVRVRGKYIYACYILNSRPSAGPFTLYLDKRVVLTTGDPYDFAGNGAQATQNPFATNDAVHVQYWISRGDKTSPPSLFLGQASDLFSSTDGWQGLTVLWIRMDAGNNDTRAERWPATPPEVMVDGRWSLVWDMRDPTQDADDPATWKWSANQALCTLDALRTNPMRPYADEYLWLETFEWAADVADQPVPVKAGGTIPRYEVNGVVVFSPGVELEDQVQPIAMAGASRFVRVGGKLGLVPGIYSPPVMTLTEYLADAPLAFTRYRPGDDLVTSVSATYVSPDREYEDAETPNFNLPGALIEDGGQGRHGRFDLRLVTDYRQAERVAKILGLRTRMQKAVNGAFPPKAFDLVGGSTVELDLPAPYLARNGVYEVEEANPSLDLLGTDGGVAMRVGLKLRETTPEVYAWNPSTDEMDVATEGFDPTIPVVMPPGEIDLISNATTVIVSGGAPVARVRFAFLRSMSPSAVGYEWQFRTTATWQSGGFIDGNVQDDDGDVFGYVIPAVLGLDYWVRVRTLSGRGSSEWVEAGPIVASDGAVPVVPPTGISATGGPGEITVVFRAPNNPDYRAMDIWRATLDDPAFAILLFGPIYGAPDTVETQIETGLGPSVTCYYFARSIDRNGQATGFSPSISATTDP